MTKENTPLTEDSLAGTIEKVSAEKEKYSVSTFFITKLTNYKALEDSYIYLRLCRHLGLYVDMKVENNFPSLMMCPEDYALTIKGSRNPEYVKKIHRIWDELDIDDIRNKLEALLQVELEKVINDQ